MMLQFNALKNPWFFCVKLFTVRFDIEISWLRLAREMKLDRFVRKSLLFKVIFEKLTFSILKF